VQKYKV